MMIKRQYKVKFVTPAFLGNAEQIGQWRTPPFKSLLRQWWRIAWATRNELDVKVLRSDEAGLFGSASDQQSKSLIQLRLDRWRMGTLTKWESLDKVNHPEVSSQIGADLYLGYGPLAYDKQTRGTKLKSSAAIQTAAIQTNETAILRLAFPDTAREEVDTALALMDRYGTIGGRSRNGWGSFTLTPIEDTPALTSVPREILCRWRDAMKQDWPHAIGKDDKGALIWQSKQPMHDWKDVMSDLAKNKIGLRTQFNFDVRGPHTRPLPRHWLSYPITHHNVNGWNNERLPNSLRFKVRQMDDGKLVGVVIHVPCLPPKSFNPRPDEIGEVWQNVHVFLDKCDSLHRVSE